MCESAAFVLTDDGEKKLMDNVVYMKVEPGQILLTDLLGEEKTVLGKIEEIKLMDHKILIRETGI